MSKKTEPYYCEVEIYNIECEGSATGDNDIFVIHYCKTYNRVIDAWIQREGYKSQCKIELKHHGFIEDGIHLMYTLSELVDHSRGNWIRCNEWLTGFVFGENYISCVVNKVEIEPK